MPTALLLALTVLFPPSTYQATEVAGSPLPDGTSPQPVRLVFGDVDGDGLDDAIAIGAAGQVSLLWNRGEGQFEDLTRASGLGQLDFATCALLFDLEGDGDLDLFAGSSAQRLWRNLGNAAFEPVDPMLVEGGVGGELSGLDHPWVDLAVHAEDRDGDELLDLHVVTEAGELLYRNLGEARFERVVVSGRGLDAEEAEDGGLDAAQDPSRLRVPSAAGGPAAGPRARLARWLRLRGASGAEPDATLDGHTTSGAPGGALEVVSSPETLCVPGLEDQTGPGCLAASSTPTLGRLYPLSQELYVDAGSGNVGMGTTAPAYALEVVGQIVSGVGNVAAGTNAAVGGGSNNTAPGQNATVAGGDGNQALADHASIGGGLGNVASGTRAAIAGGVGNRAGGSAAVGGGQSNDAQVGFGTIAGGRYNTVSGTYSAIGGGANNQATGTHAVVGGGGDDVTAANGNVASGVAATVPGGRANEAAGATSLAAGQRAKALHDGSFVWGDSSAADVSSTGPDQFVVRAEGGLLAGGTVGLGAIPVEGQGARMMWYPGKAAFRAGEVTAFGLDQWDDTNVGTWSWAFGADTIANADGSGAMGFGSRATGNYATAMGFQATASGASSAAMGLRNAASGDASVALGENSVAGGRGSVALGTSVSADSFASAALGRFNVGGGDPSNWIAGDPLLEVGMGSDAANRANALTVLKDGNVGIGTAAPTAGLVVSDDDGLLATGTYGTGPIPAEGPGTRMMWYPGKAAFRAGYVNTSPPADEWDDINVGPFSMATGNSTTASGIHSVAMGRSSTAAGAGSVALGYLNSATGTAAVAIGSSVIAEGQHSTAMGFWTRAEALSSTALGQYNLGGGDPNLWVPGDPLFEVGIGSGSGARANALTILKNGNVGIGTATPAALLQVDGGSEATPSSGGVVQVGGASGPSVVFDDDEILARTNGSASTLALNESGGDVTVSASGSGRMGIGTASPTVPLHVEGGSDASPTSGGYLQAGTPTGQNLVLDDNEIMARDNGVASVLHLNAEGGDVAIGANAPSYLGIGTGTPSVPIQVEGGTDASPLSGGYLQVGASTRNVVIDNNEIMARSGSGAALLSLNADGGDVVVGGGAGGDASVRLPSDSVGPAELLAEPGVASDLIKGSGGTVAPGGTTPVELASRSLTVPASGYVMALGSCDYTNAFALAMWGSLTVYHVEANEYSQSYATTMTPVTSGSVAVHALFSVSAGTHTFSLRGRSGPTGGTPLSVYDQRLILVYLPTAYGTTEVD